MKKEILILWRLPETKYDYEKYNLIINYFSKKLYSVKSPIDTKKFKWNDKERFKRAVEFVKNADMIIAEMTEVSTGQWIEIWIAYELNIPIFVIAKEWAKISGLIKWNPNLSEIIYFKDLEDLNKNLDNINYK